MEEEEEVEETLEKEEQQQHISLPTRAKSIWRHTRKQAYWNYNCLLKKEVYIAM